MDEARKYQLQWMALRFAVDSLDTAWTHDSEEYLENKEWYEKKRAEYKAHRQVLCDMQDEVLNRHYDARDAAEAQQQYMAVIELSPEARQEMIVANDLGNLPIEELRKRVAEAKGETYVPGAGLKKFVENLPKD